jgi:hypothetical protein
VVEAGMSSQIFSTLYAQAEEFPNKAEAIANNIEKKMGFNLGVNMRAKISVITCKDQL